MRRADPIAGVLFALAAASPVQAASRAAVSIPATTLSDAIATLGAQAGVSIGMVDPTLRFLRVPRVQGRMTIDRALATMLRGLPARAERVDAGSWRIVRSAKPAARALRRPLRRPAPMRMPLGEIVVTASKRDTTLDGYPGTAYVLTGEEITASGSSGTEAILARLPTLTATALGPGRNKLFIRGIADSSFNGPSQATIGEYLGDVRLNYNAPDPNLTLVDVASVEVLEGPQGTLYGAATLGGVLRIVPNTPKLDRIEAAMTGGIAATAHGAGSGDFAAVLNLPLVADSVGARVVGYRAVEGGYIDDTGLGRSDVNHTLVAGGRAMVRIQPGDSWTVDLGGAYQATDSRDGQYAERGAGRLARRSDTPQPFDNDYGLASLSAVRNLDRAILRISAGMVEQDLESRYDFTANGGPLTVFDESSRIRLLSGEISLARRGSDGVGWITGVSAFHNDERLTRNLGIVSAPAQILGVRNETTSISGFAEAGIRLTGTLVATIGTRLDFAHLVGEPLTGGAGPAGEPSRNEIGFLPFLALTWRPGTGATVFARYQEGFRPGGLSIAGSGAGDVQRFEGDSLSMAEAGARFADLLGSGIEGSATVSYAHWESIQADLVDVRGLPFTANIGNGRVIGFEARVGRRIVRGLRGDMALFINKSRLTQPAAFLGTVDDPALPNVAKAGGRASLALDLPLTERLGLKGDASVRYVGHSRLGVGPLLDIAQGDYLDTSVSVRIGTEVLGLSLNLTNLFDARGNRFGLGNPFDVADGRQIVPLRPRTIRFGFDARF